MSANTRFIIETSAIKSDEKLSFAINQVPNAKAILRDGNIYVCLDDFFNALPGHHINMPTHEDIYGVRYKIVYIAREKIDGVSFTGERIIRARLRFGAKLSLTVNVSLDGVPNSKKDSEVELYNDQFKMENSHRVFPPHVFMELKLLCDMAEDVGFTVTAEYQGKCDGPVYAKACTSSGSHAGGLSKEQQQANAQYIYDYLSGAGWTKQAICGALGNIEKESVMNPGVWNTWHSITQAYGLIQWYTAGKKILKWLELTDKVDKVDELAENYPKLWMDKQLEYLLFSLSTNDPVHGGWVMGGRQDYYDIVPLEHGTPGNMSYNQYISSTHDHRDLALVFHASCERSEITSTIEASLRERVDNAHGWYTFFS